MVFFPEHIRMLLKEGHTVELACNTDESPVPAAFDEFHLKVHNIPFSRSPLSKDNLEGYKAIKKLIQSGRYNLVHTHTPNASVCVRLACKDLRKKGLQVYYTAHGFHFYKGAPLKNWLMYYPVEWICAHWTDTLITINKEDYLLAKRHMHAKRVCYIPGIGVDFSRFTAHVKPKEETRKELGIPQEAFVLLAVGEVADRKNQKVIIDALGKLQDKSIYLLLAGDGDRMEDYKHLAQQYGLTDNIRFLGKRDDADALCDAADVFVHPSVREGLGLAPLEGMAAGLPLISSYINGIKDYTKDGITGCAIKDPHDVDAFAKAIKKMQDDGSFRTKCSRFNIKEAQKFEMQASVDKMQKIYGGGDTSI